MRDNNSSSPIRIHKLIFEKVIDALQDTFENETAHADKVIEKKMKSEPKWGSRDRRFFAENVYECVRWFRLYRFLSDENISERQSGEFNLQRQDYVKVWLTHWLLKGEQRPEFLQGIRLPSLDEMKRKKTKASRAVRESIPDWLDELGEIELGDRWEPILKSLNLKSEVDLRCNTLLIPRDQLLKKLNEEGINAQKIPNSEVGLTLLERKNVFTTQAFKNGFFEMQDRASQKVSELLNPQPGERVVDACAGAGGKSLHLATLMKNKGKLLCMDVRDYKLEDLLKRARRNKITCIETRAIDSTKVIKRQEEMADRVLLDVPCSGLGVLRRNPDSKWKLKPEQIDSLRKTQSDILALYSRMVKPGGHLVYATCSFLPSEDEQQVKSFLATSNANFKLVKEIRNDPDLGSGDGFYAALLQRA